MKSFLVIYNVSNQINVGSLIRTANAFATTEVILVGRRRRNLVGSCGLSGKTRFRHFYTLDDACHYLRERGCTIYGIEIRGDAVAISDHPFRGTSAFMVGNEGTGLSEFQIKHCDEYLYVPQFGEAECLNVSVAAGIVLHHFATWAQFTERPRSGGVFVPGDF